MSERLRDVEDVRRWLAANVYRPADGDPAVGKVGLEAELFPFWLAKDGRPAARFALVELMAVLEEVPGVVRNPDSADGRPSWRMGTTLLTEEPGAQLEVAGPPEPDAHTAVVGLEDVIERLSTVFAEAGAGLAAAGLDCWSDQDQLPVQVAIPRYDAMTAYFERRGDRRQGHLLMCSSCSLQVNVDLGPPAVAADRWLLANLAAPVLTAAFAASPAPDAVNGRAMGWRSLDDTRTGVAPPLVAGVEDPVEHVLADALRADVMLVEREGTAIAGGPGWTFGHWVREGHPRFGPPTDRDLATHLTTLFPESRLRGFLEVRGVDELPPPWRGAAVALVCGLLYDDEAAATALDVLRPHRADVPQLLDRAARRGLGDDVVADVSVRVLDAALEGAGRLGLPEAADAAGYLDRFTHRRRHPSDDLRERLDRDATEAFRWASQPHDEA